MFFNPNAREPIDPVDTIDMRRASSRRISGRATVIRLAAARRDIKRAAGLDGRVARVAPARIHLCHKTGPAPPQNGLSRRRSRESWPPQCRKSSMVKKANSARRQWNLRQRNKRLHKILNGQRAPPRCSHRG